MSGPFDHLLNWRLLQGGHDFPGPDGGTCINEAAVVAAGMPYRRIMGVDDLPECFSHPLSIFALGLNDAMDDQERERLMPFVMRLAGTRDTDHIERERAGLILVQTGRRILAPLLRSSGFKELADDIEAVERRCQLTGTRMQRRIAAVGKIRTSLASDRASVRARHCSGAADEFSSALRVTANEAKALKCAHAVGHAASADYVAAAQVWETACEILDAACRIGRQPDPIAAPLIQERFEVARANAPTPEFVA